MNDSTPRPQPCEPYIDFVRACAKLRNLSKSQVVHAGARKYSFVPLPEILDDVRPILAEFNQTVTWTSRKEGEWLFIECLVIHASATLGHRTVVASAMIPVLVRNIPDDMQPLGSRVTYAKRYTIMMALPLAAEEDDDGQAASRQRPVTAKRGTAPAWYGLTEARIGELSDVAREIENGTPEVALKWYRGITDESEKTYLWSLLSKPAKLRLSAARGASPPAAPSTAPAAPPRAAGG